MMEEHWTGHSVDKMVRTRLEAVVGPVTGSSSESSQVPGCWAVPQLNPVPDWLPCLTLPRCGGQGEREAGLSLLLYEEANPASTP